MNEQIVEKIYDGSAALFRRQVKNAVTLMEAVCESPIEVQLGAALCVGAGRSADQYARCQMVVGLPAHPIHPKQWMLIPQFTWEKYRIDFALFTQLPHPIFIECDGHDFHERTKEQAQHDREKDRAIQAAGIPILRFTGSEIHRRPVYCAGQVVGFVINRLKDHNASVSASTKEPA